MEGEIIIKEKGYAEENEANPLLLGIKNMQVYSGCPT